MLSSIEEVIGKNSLNAVLEQASLSGFYESVTAARDGKAASLKPLSLLQKNLELSYGARGGQGLAAPEGGWSYAEALNGLGGALRPLLVRFDEAMSDDLNTPVALTELEELLSLKKMDPDETLAALAAMDAVMGLGLLELERADLRLRPKDAAIDGAEIETELERRKAARAEKDFATSDAIRDDLAARGVEVMDGDPLGWDWRLTIG